MTTILETKQITKSFGGLLAVDNVSFSVQEHEIVGLIGPNGAGKTTLFHLLSGFYKATKGEIFLDGERITSLAAQDICKRGIARTFQVVKPFEELSVLQNVMVGAYLRHAVNADAVRYAQEMLDFVEFPVDYHKNSASLNLSQKKRMEMARALATRPRVLLLDEVMAGLNHSEVDKLILTVQRIRDELKVTIIAVEHVMRAIMTISDRIIVLDYGEKIAEGKPQEIASNPKVIEAYLGRKRDGETRN